MTKKYEIFLQGLGQALRDARISKGMTQAELGEKSGRTQSAIGKIERGPLPGIPLNVLFEVTEAIPLSLTELFIKASQYEVDKKKEKNISSLVTLIERLPKHKKASVERILRESLALLPASGR
jgi:transcriptional regulator with XRE-family HTH domain|tara:strand:+ start:257 stop:625 length:369 start_codon:yes stop_codon:yes gene_type:complete